MILISNFYTYFLISFANKCYFLNNFLIRLLVCDGCAILCMGRGQAQSSACLSGICQNVQVCQYNKKYP